MALFLLQTVTETHAFSASIAKASTKQAIRGREAQRACWIAVTALQSILVTTSLFCSCAIAKTAVCATSTLTANLQAQLPGISAAHARSAFFRIMSSFQSSKAE